MPRYYAMMKLGMDVVHQTGWMPERQGGLS